MIVEALHGFATQGEAEARIVLNRFGSSLIEALHSEPGSKPFMERMGIAFELVCEQDKSEGLSRQVFESMIAKMGGVIQSFEVQIVDQTARDRVNSLSIARFRQHEEEKALALPFPVTRIHPASLDWRIGFVEGFNKQQVDLSNLEPQKIPVLV